MQDAELMAVARRVRRRSTACDGASLPYTPRNPAVPDLAVPMRPEWLDSEHLHAHHNLTNVDMEIMGYLSLTSRYWTW